MPWRTAPPLASLIVCVLLVPAVGQAGDYDQDGAPDSLDICNNTPPGLIVDYWGRPYADFDQDCDVDAADLAFLVTQYTGSLPPPPHLTSPDNDTDGDGVNDPRDVCDNTPIRVVVDHWGRPYGDWFHDCDVDLQEFSFFQIQYTGELVSCEEGSPCDDGIACTVDDVCVRNRCVGTPDDSACEDGLFCNGLATCDAQAGCMFPPPVDCSYLDAACQIGVCDETLDACVAAAVDEGVPCNDGAPCTTGETCMDGSCGGGVPVDCSALDGDCGTGACDPQTGECRTVPSNPGDPCDDALYCTVNTTCTNGECGNGQPRDCSDLNEVCRVGVCNETLDACEAAPFANGTGCDDGSVCTIGDVCSGGECVGTALPDRTPCDDGDPTTDRSICVAGSCAASDVYTVNTPLVYNCPEGGIFFNISSFEFVDDGQTLWVFNAPAVMSGPGGIGPNGTFVVTGSITDGTCTKTFNLQGQFNGPSWTGTFEAQFYGCGACGWPRWNNIRGELQWCVEGSPCDDGSVCTVVDACSVGACVGTPLPDRTPCDDGDPDTDQSICVTGHCAANALYTLNTTLNYNCPAGGIFLSLSAFEFADDGETLWVLNAPAVMSGLGGIGPNGMFSVTGSANSGSCTQTFLLNGAFNGAGWTGTFEARFVGCGECGWPKWNNIQGWPQ